MNNFIISLNVVLPLFLVIALGYGLQLLGMYEVVALKTMNTCFKVFIPLIYW